MHILENYKEAKNAEYIQHPSIDHNLFICCFEYSYQHHSKCMFFVIQFALIALNGHILLNSTHIT